jgi:hypothetical protein
MDRKIKPDFVVGIDPGSTTGLALLRKDGSFLDCWTFDFFTVQDFLCSTFPRRSNVRIFVELPPRFVYDRHRGADDKAKGGDLQSMHIGGNRREAELLKLALDRLGFHAEHVNPVPQKKWDDKRFRLFTKASKPTSQHERDATRLAIHYLNKK